MTNSEKTRLPKNPSHIIDKSNPVRFNFNGKTYKGYKGDSIASALYAAGIRIFTRSFKYHRSRGLLCVEGNCPNCLMNVNGVPNVKACCIDIEKGMDVRHQNAWPSQDHDFMSILDKLDRLMPIGFYYKTFHTPKLFWKLIRPIIRRVSGLGNVPKKPISKINYHKFSHSDIAIVGGGPAGMSSAIVAAKEGFKVTIIDNQPNLGGHLRYDTSTHQILADTEPVSGFEIAADLAKQVQSFTNINILNNSTVFGIYEGNLLGITSNDSMLKLRAKQIIVSTGSYEIPLTFDRNDLPGVMLSTGVQRLINLYGIKPGKTALIATTNDHGYTVAQDLLNAGVRIAVLADTRPDFPHHLPTAQSLQSNGVLILPEHALVRAEGIKRVVGGVISKTENGLATSKERQIDSDIIVMSSGFQPAISLINQIGNFSKHDKSTGQTLPTQLPESIFTAGDINGTHDPLISINEGKLIGQKATLNLNQNKSHKSIESDIASLNNLQNNYRVKNINSPQPLQRNFGSKQFVCLCEDVTFKDITKGIDEGFEDIQTLKRYSTVTMGPCQGKMCHKTFVDIASKHTSKDINDLGSTTSRPPVEPVSLGILAGHSKIPTKLTPLDMKHRALDAKMIDSNQWKRPQVYSTPEKEALIVRNGVGIIDLSTLGKLDIRGVDAPALVDKMYTHNFSTLRIGRIRYGVLCTDNGTILDDGTVARVSKEQYFATTSTASVETIEEWFKWWMAGDNICAHITNVTSGYSAINVAGPQSRNTLEKLTNLDLSTKSFPYMHFKQGFVAGIQTMLLRIGFVGETGWELHFPSEYGEHMWDALMEAGNEFEITPFGTEAQRILRLEKKHIIPNQDTDMLSSPIESDMEWVVKFDKSDFIGKAGLLARKKHPSRNRLEGFVMRNETVPHDGDAVVVEALPVGKVTSSRLSPTTDKGFGLCWVPEDLAVQGNTIFINTDGIISPASVEMNPIYDPKGNRLKE